MERITLSAEELNKLNAMDGDITFLEDELARAKRAGIEIGTLEVELEKIKKLRAGLIREYSS